MMQLGYYVTEPIIRPPNSVSPLPWVYTLADTIGRHHPKVDPLLRRDPKRREQYRQQLGLTEAEMEKMYEMADRLVQQRLLAWDGRFARLADARAFYSRFIRDKRVMILGLTAAEQYLPRLEESEFFDEIPKEYLTDAIEGPALGWEILGWDGPRSASWLEDGLDELLSMEQPLVVTRWGFLAHKPEEVEAFAAWLKGIWTPEEYWPFEVRDCT